MATLPTYASRELLKAAHDVKLSARADAQIDRLLAAASRGIERGFRRAFYPTTASRVLEWPPRGSFWLYEDLLSVSSVSIDGVAVTGYVLEPRSGPPYHRINFDDATVTGGDLVTVTGDWGFCNDTVPAGTLVGAVASTTATSLVVSDSSRVGVGDLLLASTERLVVTGRSSSSVGTTLGGNIAAQDNVVTVPVADGTKVALGETITIDAERMLVLDIVGNNLTVKRAFDGSVLAAHTSGATVYAPRTLTVARGCCGTQAETHLNGLALSRYVAPPEIIELTIAEAMVSLSQEGAGWSATIGSGEGEREAAGRAVGSLRARARDLYGRKRMGAV